MVELPPEPELLPLLDPELLTVPAHAAVLVPQTPFPQHVAWSSGQQY